MDDHFESPDINFWYTKNEVYFFKLSGQGENMLFASNTEIICNFT